MGTFLESLNDETRYETKRGVPVFKPHTRTLPKLDKDGKEVPGETVEIVVTEKDLEDVKRASRTAEAADSAWPVTVGHRRFEAGFPETQQPPRAAYLFNFQTGPGNDGPVVLADVAYDRDTYEKFGPKQFPYFSVDYRIGAKQIFGGAVLVRKPELDLGVIPYQSGGDLIACYGCNCTGAYEMADDANKMSPEDEAQYAEFAGYAAKFGKDKFAKYMAKYAAAMGPANAAPPAAGAAPVGPDTAGYEARIKTLEEANRAALDANKKTEVRRQLDRLRGVGVKFDEEREVKYMATLDEAGVTAHLSYMADTYQCTAGQMIAMPNDPIVPYQANDATKAPPKHEQIMAWVRAQPGRQYEDGKAALSPK